MTENERAIWSALVELEQAAKSPPADSKPNLSALLQRVDELTKQLPEGTAPELLHYLHRKSYEKARLWLESRQG